ncbi:hypothetical protein MPL3356_60607 [Mesorhizobium plurifarium]|uniref:Uncharacterized protein n=1 Tax=Mesorhizobium plurifarium TaxID=69974 RepID=A0A090EA99_MESPL|nr:hypothetical protein MPL3356_60607 [Mesorhizobium plurifarium]
MSTLFLFAGAVLMFGCVGRRLYLEMTGSWSPFESHVIASWIAFIGAILFVIGILLGAAPVTTFTHN